MRSKEVLLSDARQNRSLRNGFVANSCWFSALRKRLHMVHRCHFLIPECENQQAISFPVPRPI